MKTESSVQRNQRISSFYSSFAIFCSFGYITLSMSEKSIAQHFGVSKTVVSFIGMLLILASAAASWALCAVARRTLEASLISQGRGDEITANRAVMKKLFFKLLLYIAVPIFLFLAIAIAFANQRCTARRAQIEADTKKIQSVTLRLEKLNANFAQIDTIKNKTLRKRKLQEYQAQFTAIEKNHAAVEKRVRAHESDCCSTK